MKVTEIAFSGYPVTDLKRARQFYEVTLGLKPTKVFGDANMAWVEYDIGPGTLALSNFAEDWKPSADGGGGGKTTTFLFGEAGTSSTVGGISTGGTTFGGGGGAGVATTGGGGS